MYVYTALICIPEVTQRQCYASILLIMLIMLIKLIKLVKLVKT